MRNYLITPLEKEMIREYLSTGRKPEGFRTLVYRVRRLDLPAIKEEVELVESLLAAVEGEEEVYRALSHS